MRRQCQIKTRPEPIDTRGDLKEAPMLPSSKEETGPGYKPPPPRLASLTFPTDRLPQLDVEIVKRLPGVGDPEASPEDGPPVTNNHNLDPSLPSALVLEKNMYNLWEKTKTQNEVKWSKPSNTDKFSGMKYEIQIKIGDEDWKDLTESRQTLYRVYYVEGVAIFGRNKVSQDSAVKMVRLRVRGVGENTVSGTVNKMFGPWSEDILFSLEGIKQ